MKTFYSIIFFFFSFAVVFSQTEEIVKHENFKVDYFNEFERAGLEKTSAQHLRNPEFNANNRFTGAEHQILKEKKPEIQSKIFLFDKIIVYSNRDGKYRYSYSYDANGNRLSYLREIRENEQWVNSFRFAYTYDTNGNKLSHLYEIWENEQWVNYSRGTYTYDSNGNMLSYLYERWETGQWVNYRRYSYTYNINGNKLSELSEGWENEQWVNRYRDSYTYDTNGNILSYLDERWENGQLVSRYRRTYTYDTNGNKLSYLEEDWENEQWVNVRQYTYTYDTNGNKLSYLYEKWENEQWLNDYRHNYSYDENGNMLSYFAEGWENEQWVNVRQYTYTYDTNGNMLSVLWEYWQNGQWVNDYRGTYSYDTNGNMLSYLSEHWENEQWVNSYRSAYTYDTNGNMLSELYEKWENEQWVNVSQYTYTYDSNGNMLLRYYETWENGQWIDTDTNLSFSDSSGNFYYLYGYEIKIFWKQQHPAAFQLKYPEDGTNRMTTTPVLEWYESSGAETYHLQVAGDIDFAQIIYEVSEISKTSATVSNLSNGTEYFWRVKAFSDIDSSDWSEIWSFRTIMLAPDAAPILISPENNSQNIAIDTTLFFFWNETDMAEGYHLQLGTAENFEQGSIVTEDSLLTETLKQVSGLDYETDYYWRVLAWNEGGKGPWSEIWKFTTAEFVSVDGNNNSTNHYSIFPNPFSNATKINYEIANPANIKIDIYNSLGYKITTLVNEYQDAGSRSAVFSGSNISAGVYYYTIQIEERIERGKLVLVR